MKYHTMSTSSLSSEGKKSTLTIYTGPDFIRNKMDSTETEIVRCELEMAQRALKLQTRRCRQLVSEYTRKLQTKELEVISERRLRDEQLTKVLRSLLVFEARLKQEQVFIRHQLEEKDDLIQRQRKELRGLRSTVQYCKTCSQFYYNSNSNVDSCDSSSEYCVGIQENWESGSDVYGSISEYSRPHSSGEDSQKTDIENTKLIYEKNKYSKLNNDCNYKKTKKTNNYRRTTGTFYEVLKSRESSAESSPEDVASDLSDTQKTKEQIEKVSERIKELFIENSNISDTYSSKMDNLHGIKKSTPEPIIYEEDVAISPIQRSKPQKLLNGNEKQTKTNFINENSIKNENEHDISQLELNTVKNRNISETISVFDAGDGEQNNKWYVSVSDQEEDDQRDIYRNNPVLECMNQILLQNINDSLNSPPKSPELDRNPKNKTQKRVKFSDESNEIPPLIESVSPTCIKTTELIKETIVDNNEIIKAPSSNGDYYETPIQGAANFYEVPQSIYSNDYEQIMSKCSNDSVHNWSPVKVPSPTSKTENLQENKINRMSTQKLTIAKSKVLEDLDNKNHYYIDMDTTYPPRSVEIVKKTKVARTPPALPPKPANLVSKFKMLNRSVDNLEDFTADSEPDYCSISELNLPTEKMIMSKNNISSTQVNSELKPDLLLYDPISLNGSLSTIIGTSAAEKNSFQVAKQPQIKNGKLVSNMASIAQINMLKTKNEVEIPKLPQVSEIIIPEETEEKKSNNIQISQDNYIKNNSQILKQKTLYNDKFRNRIVIGRSVSSIISNFNNQYNLSLNSNKKIITEKYKINDKLFSSFEYPQDYEKQQQKSPTEKLKIETPSFEKFDLSQNFEEFNLDDCEIGEEYQSESSNSLNYNVNNNNNKEIENSNLNTINIANNQIEENKMELEWKSNLSNEKIRTSIENEINTKNISSLQQLQKSLLNQRTNNINCTNSENNIINRNPEPSYEHFLECTGLSSKSILTPSRMLSNHKSMLKPKDIKLRSRAKSAVFEQSNGSVKYWSEPYL